MNMCKSRNQLIDAVRATAIVLVVVGHCVQYGSGREYLNSGAYFDDAVFKYIYSFHMPLFAGISGYCFFVTVSKRSLIETVKDRMQKLVVPMIAWQFIINIFKTAKLVITSGGGYNNILLGYREITQNMWFLWSVLGLSLGVAIVHYLLNDSIVVFVLGFIATPFIPKIGMLLWLYPFFVGAYLAAKNKDVLRRCYDAIKKQGVFVCFFAHLLMAIFWRREYYIYTPVGTSLTIYGQENVCIWLIAIFYRITAGGAGSLMVIGTMERILRHMKRERVLSWAYTISRFSLGIYVFSVHIINPLLGYVPFDGRHYSLIIFEAVVVLLLSVLFMKEVERFPLFGRLLTGGR